MAPTNNPVSGSPGPVTSLFVGLAMNRFKILSEQIAIFTQLSRWTLIVIPLAVSVGSLVAFFLWALDQATHLRWENPWLLYLLPAAGVLIYFMYARFGKNAESGNNLIMDEIHRPGAGIPLRMAPLVLLSTVVTHLFGGSAGREGTAVQMGGSVAYFLARKFQLKPSDFGLVLTCGVAAGFGAVFGTPLTGTVFALEVLAIGTMRYHALIPCLAASLVAHFTCTAWGVGHSVYHISYVEQVADFLPVLPFDLGLLLKVIGAGIAFGLASLLFAEMSHALKKQVHLLIHRKWLIPIAGGGAVIGLSLLLGTDDYLGLGVHGQLPGSVSITSAFSVGGASTWSWFWKLTFTVITLSTGFKGGEVTPLFFIGATLGNTLALLSGAPVDLFAGLGFIAVFAGATNTPLACTIMGIELFGSENMLYYAIACFTAYYFSGHTGIYGSQRIAVSKFLQDENVETPTLNEAREKRRMHRSPDRIDLWIRRYWRRKT